MNYSLLHFIRNMRFEFDLRPNSFPAKSVTICCSYIAYDLGLTMSMLNGFSAARRNIK